MNVPLITKFTNAVYYNTLHFYRNHDLLVSNWFENKNLKHAMYVCVLSQTYQHKLFICAKEMQRSALI